MTFSQKLPIIQHTEFPMTDTDIVMKYFTTPFPSKSNLILIILKKFNLIKSLSHKKTSIFLSSLDLKSLNSTFSLSNLSKHDIETIEQNLSLGHIFKQKDIKHKIKNDLTDEGVINLFKLDSQFSEFTNNTEHTLLFFIVNNLIDFYESSHSFLIYDFLKTIEPLFIFMFRYFIRTIYQFKNSFKKEELIYTSDLVVRTFLRLSSLLDQQNEYFYKNKDETFSEADHNTFNLYDIEIHKLLSHIYSGLIEYLQTHESEKITDKDIITLLQNVGQISYFCLQKRHTMLPLFQFSTTSTTPFITFELHQFLLLSSIHRINLILNHNFSDDELNNVMNVLLSLLVIEPNSQSFEDLKNKMISDGKLMNTYENNATMILFGPFVKIAVNAFNYMLNLSSSNKKDDNETKEESIYRFCTFMLSCMITVIEKAPNLSDYCSDNDLYSLTSSFLIFNMKSFAQEILNNIKTAFEKDINNIASLDCNCEFKPFCNYESTIKDNRIRNWIFLPKINELKINVSGSTKDYISECALSFNTPEYHSQITKLSPKFDKLLTINFKQKKDSLFIRNVLMKLTSMILTDYSSFAIVIDDQKDYSENTIMLFFLINLIIVSSNETNTQLFKVFDLLNILTNLFVFDEKFYPLVKDKNYSHFNPVSLFIYNNLQYSVMTIINRNFQNFPSEIINLILTKIDTSNSLEQSNIFQVLLNQVYASNIPEFLNYGMNNERLFIVLVNYVAKMRKIFYLNANRYSEIKSKNETIDPELLKGNLIFLHQIHECRKNVMLFLILLTLESNTIFSLYSNEIPVTLMADECLEDIFSKIALDFLCHGLQIVESKYNFEDIKPHKLPLGVVTRSVMKLLIKCVRQSEKNNEHKKKYLSLILDILLIITNAVQINQQLLVVTFIRCNFLRLLFSLPEKIMKLSSNENDKKEIHDETSELSEITDIKDKDSSLDDLQTDILDQVIFIICALAEKNNEFKKAAYKSLIKFANFLRTLKLKETTINALLQLLFEKDVQLRNLPEICEILFNNALIIIHTALEKDYQHYLKIFDYICKIAQRSYANRLHIFQANFPHFIINYIANQNKQNTLTYENQEDLDARIKSIDVLWKIYQVVSADLYKPSTFVNMFYLIKDKRKKRHWYTSHILSIFDNILSKKFSQKTASSYFHFSGNKCGIYVPRIDLTPKSDQQTQKSVEQDSTANEITDGSWTFCCLFLIDNIVYENSIRNSCLMSFTSQPITSSSNAYGSSKKIAPSKMKLVFEPPYIFFVFESPSQNAKVIEKINFEFKPCLWYHFVITISKLKYVKIYINGTKYFHKNIAQLDLSSVLENFSVANSFSCPFSINKNYSTLSQRNQQTREITNDIVKNIYSDNDSSLICNMACCYLFCRKLSNKIVADMANLPYDYVYSFISSNQNLFHNLPETLFTGEIEKYLIFCYNAKLCENQNVCINLKRNGKVGNGIFNGDIVPYNLTSITSFGGLKIFLPLFDQVDYPIDHSNEISHDHEKTETEILNEKREFLVVLLNIFAYCIRLSSDVEAMFCKENGIHALSYAFSSLDPEDWSPEAFKSLHQLFISLRSEAYQMDMIQYILFNPTVWRKLSNENYANYKDICILSVLFANKTKEDQQLINVLTRYAGFTHLLIEILEKKDDELRNIYWNLIVTYAHLGLVKSNEIKRLFLFAFSDDSFYIHHDVKYINQIQAIKALYKIVSNKFSDFHMLLTSTNYFNSIMLFAQSKSEIIRMYGLKFLLLIKDYLDTKIIVDIPPIPVNQMFSTYINLLSLEDVSIYSFNELLKLVFKDDIDNKLIIQLLPFFAIYSSFANSDLINKFAQEIIKRLSLTNDSIKQTSKNNHKNVNFFDLLTCSPNWDENLFYIFTQSSTPFNFSNYEDNNYHLFVQIYAKIFTYFLMNDKNSNFTNSMNTLGLIQYMTNWNVTDFVRSILIEMMNDLNKDISSLNDEKWLKDNKKDFDNFHATLFSNAFKFLMIIPSYEDYSTDNQELFKPETSSKRITIINEKMSYKDFVELQFNQQIDKTKLNSLFTPRSDEKGNWIDKELAEIFSTTLFNIFKLHLKSNNYNFGSIPIYTKLTNIVDLFTLNEMLLMKSTKKSLKETIEQKFIFLKEFINQNIDNAILSLSMIVNFSVSSLNGDEDHKKFNEIIQIISKYLESQEQPKKTTNNQETTQYDDKRIIEFASEKTDEFISSIVNRHQSTILTLHKNYSSIVSNLVNSYKVKITKISVTPQPDGIFFQKMLQQYVETLSHFCGVCETAYKNLRRDVLKNSGLWKSNTSDPIHWKLSLFLDNEFRHNVMEPNNHYTDHIDASIRRDVGDESIAKAKIAEISQKKEEKKAKNNKDIIDIVNTEETTDKNNEETENESANKTYIINTQARLITIEGNYSGYLSLNGKELLFTGTLENEDDFFLDSSSSNTITKDSLLDVNRAKKSIEISLKIIVMILLRNYLHLQSGFEIFLTTNRSYFFFLPNMDRKNVFRFLVKQNMPNLKYFQLSPEQNSFINEFKITEKWQKKQISNYEYILLLNLCAGRSFNDLSQYPVFPWVLTNYKSNELDLKDINNFRDLSRPLGTLNEERLEKLKFSCENRPELELPPFLYRLHYSTAYNVTAFMIRVEPYTSIYLKLNGGRFDIKERIINSIAQIWDAVTSYQNEFRELIPEVYTTPELFLNDNKIDLGGIIKSENAQNATKSKKKRSEVELIIGGNDNNSIDYYKGRNDFLLLPPWAKSNPYYFITKHREALESDYVSLHLNEWIDLIFGIKQMGEEATKANNTFHPYSYPSFVTPQVLKDKELMRDIQLKIRDFGITPFQIFKNDYHPSRFESLLESVALNNQSSGPISFITSFFKRKPTPRRLSMSKTTNNNDSTTKNDTTSSAVQNKGNEESVSNIDDENKQFFNKQHEITRFSIDNRPIFASANRKIIVVLTINAHLYVFKKIHKGSSNKNSNSKKIRSKNNEKDQKVTDEKHEQRYSLLSLHDISQFVTLTELKSRYLKNCCTMFDNIIYTSNSQKQRMSFFIVSSPEDISFHVFQINENNGAVSHITSSHEQAIIKHIVSAPNCTSFIASSKDTSISCFSIKGEGKNFVLSQGATSQTNEFEIPSPLEIASHMIAATSAITTILSPSSSNQPNNTKLVSCSAVPSLANVSIELDKTFRIMTHSAPIVDIFESSTQNICISADEMNRIIFTNIHDGAYIRSLCFAKLIKIKVVLDENTDPNIAKFFALIQSSQSQAKPIKRVTLNARQNVKFVMISDGFPCSLIACTINAFLPNQNSNLKLNSNSNSNVNNTSDFSTSGLFSTGPQYLLTQDENSLLLSDLRSNLLISNDNNMTDSTNNNDSENIDTSSQINIKKQSEDENESSKLSIELDSSKQSIESQTSNENNNNINNINNVNNDSDIDIYSKFKSNHHHNYITRTVLYSYDLDGHLINYKLTDSKIISWCEVKSNASSTSKLVVAFSNKSICAYNLPCLELISSITLENVPIIMYYNEDRNKLIIVQEGNEFSISDLDLAE